MKLLLIAHVILFTGGDELKSCAAVYLHTLCVDAGWNEHVAQPQDSQGLGNSMGFEYDPGFVGKAFVVRASASYGYH